MCTLDFLAEALQRANVILERPNILHRLTALLHKESKAEGQPANTIHSAPASMHGKAGGGG